MLDESRKLRRIMYKGVSFLREVGGKVFLRGLGEVVIEKLLGEWVNAWATEGEGHVEGQRHDLHLSLDFP